MSPTLIAILAAVVGFALGAAIVYLASSRRRSYELKNHFGHEYDRLVDETGSRSRAEAALEERRTRVHHLQLRHLGEAERVSFERGWNLVQARFVDDPSAALTEADSLINRIMYTVGYPTHDFEQQAADISVDHPRVVQHYREAHSVAIRNTERRATTEDLRHAMLHYRALFEELLAEPAWAGSERSRP